MFCDEIVHDPRDLSKMSSIASFFLWFSQLVHRTFLPQHETRQNTPKKSSETSNIGIVAPDTHRFKETMNTKFSYNEHERLLMNWKEKIHKLKYCTLWNFKFQFFGLLHRDFTFYKVLHFLHRNAFKWCLIGFAKHKRKCSQNKYFCYHCC